MSKYTVTNVNQKTRTVTISSTPNRSGYYHYQQPLAGNMNIIEPPTKWHPTHICTKGLSGWTEWGLYYSFPKGSLVLLTIPDHTHELIGAFNEMYNVVLHKSFASHFEARDTQFNNALDALLED